MIDPTTTLAFSMHENKGIYALLLGSGLSRAAQIPTGWEITLDLVRRVAALENVINQKDWAAWYQGRFGEPPNYSRLLDMLSRTAAERRAILHSYIEPTTDDLETGSKRPTKAHHAIARLVRDGFVRVLVTTNFDRLLETALREAGIEPTIIKSEDDLRGAVPIVHARCIVLKVHGDYLDTRLLNTDAELEKYGKRLSQYLDRIFDEHGLIICGWSGEWDHALRAAIARTPNRRYPTYWAIRGELARVAAEVAQLKGATTIAIADADGFFDGLQQKVETLASSARAHPQSAQLLVGTAKRFLAKDEHRIQLADLVLGEVANARTAISAKDYSGRGAFTNEEFISRLDSYEGVYEPLCRVAMAMGRWGTGSEFETAREALQALARGPEWNGNVVWLHLMSYPAVIFFTAYGLGAAKAGRLPLLFRWLNQPLYKQRRGEDVPAHSLLFGQTWEGAERELWNRLDPSVNRWPPFNDHLLTVIQSWASAEFYDEADIELTFEWLELLVGALATISRAGGGVLEATLESNQGQRNFIHVPIGRAAWHTGNQERLLQRFTEESTANALVAAGFAEGNRETLALVERNFRRVMDNQSWR